MDGVDCSIESVSMLSSEWLGHANVLVECLGYTVSKREEFDTWDDLGGFLGAEDLADLSLPDWVVIFSQLGHIAVTGFKCFICHIYS